MAQVILLRCSINLVYLAWRSSAVIVGILDAQIIDCRRVECCVSGESQERMEIVCDTIGALGKVGWGSCR